MKIAYVVSDLRRVGPTNQTLNIIKTAGHKGESLVITLFKESSNTMIGDYKRDHIKIICLGINRYTFIFTGKRRLTKILKSNKIDLVHSYGVKPDSLCAKVCKKLEIPHIITLRNYPKEDILMRMNYFKGKLALFSHIRALKHTKNIVACSETILKKMKRDYPDMDIRVIQNGVNIEKFHELRMDKNRLRKKLGVPGDKKIIISTSSFTKRKRIKESIVGYKKSREDDWCFVLLGTGEDWNTLVDKNKNEKDILFLGGVKNVNDYLNASDVFVSTSESEGLPNGVIEAIAAKIPVVLSDIPQHIEVLRAVPNSGLTYRLGDVDDLSKALKTAISFDSSKSNIRESTLNMYNMGRRYSDYYEEVLGG